MNKELPAPTLTDKDIIRFDAKVPEKPAKGCWFWTGRLRNGYGAFGIYRGPYAGIYYAHRIAYQLAYGPIPSKLVIDHKCHNPSCVNPDHLEPVTVAENIQRAYSRDGKVHHWSAKTHCPKGHPYDSRNTYVTPDGRRDCKTCHNERSRAYKARKKQQIHLLPASNS